MVLKICFLFLFCCFYFLDAAKSIDMDYYLSYLRNSNCYGKEGLRICQNNCRKSPAICHKGECYCHQSIVDYLSPSKTSVARKDEVQVNRAPQIGPKSYEDEPVIMLTKEALRPALRHQIAHFCPNLDVARKCIKKCVQQGKAAFCGKDHICYCGHRYSFHDSKNDQSGLDIYKQFSDMYAKYFGNAGPPNDEEEPADNEDDTFLKHKNKNGTATKAI